MTKLLQHVVLLLFITVQHRYPHA